MRDGQELEKTLVEACIVVAWQAGELSEGQAMRRLGVDRLAAREIRNEFIAEGVKVRLVDEVSRL